MNVTIDSFGRILIPKAVRDQLGLKSGSELLLEATPDHELHLKPKPRDAVLVKKGATLVYTGQTTADLKNAVTEMREQRTQDIFGG